MKIVPVIKINVKLYYDINVNRGNIYIVGVHLNGSYYLLNKKIVPY